MSLTTSLTKRLSSFPLISLRRRFLRQRPPYSRSDAKQNSYNQNRPWNYGRARRCPSTKSATNFRKKIEWRHLLFLVFPSTCTLLEGEKIYTLIHPSIEQGAKYSVVSFHFRPLISAFSKWKATMVTQIVIKNCNKIVESLDSRCPVWIV